MARTKIDYGIDLGTTNSSIARIDDGEIRIIKSDDGQSDTTPSCVHINKKRILFVGQKAINLLSKEAADSYKHNFTEQKNTYIEFKRTMGTDKEYFSSNMGRNFSSEELSSEVLKKLKSYVRDDDEIKAVIITVPAMFNQSQIDATHRASELAGFKYCELLQEPIAASMAYGLSAKNLNGYWLVFDFGGGTFDAALMKVIDGIIKVLDTSGDNHLGGKDIDHSIVDKILIPYLSKNFKIEKIIYEEKGKNLLRETLKSSAEEIKIEFSTKNQLAYYKDDIGEDDTGEELILDLTIPLDEYEEVVSPIYQRAVDICQKLLERNNLTGNDLETTILIGGPTFQQTLRRMLKEKLKTQIDVSIDPMTAVAQGAALFASTKDIPFNLQIRDKAKIQLKLKYPETTVETEEKLGLKVERALTEGEVPSRVLAEVSRNDKGWSSGKKEIEGDAEIIDLVLVLGKTNGFLITLFDEKGNIYPCEPSSFTIIQGLKAANATLPLSLCIRALYAKNGKECKIPIPGLEKNKQLPAKGKDTYKIQQDIRPGNKTDIIEIGIYDAKVPYERAFLDECEGKFIISGESLPQFLPKGSDVEITIEVDSSRRISCKAFFPYIDETVEKETYQEEKTKTPDAEVLENDIKKARHSLSIIAANLSESDNPNVGKIEKDLNEINNLLEAGKSDVDNRKKVLGRLHELWRNIDKLQEESEWPKAEQELNSALELITKNQERYGNDKTAEIINQFKQQAMHIIGSKDVKNAKELADNIHGLNISILREDIGFWVYLLKDFDDNFEIHEWKNRNIARQLINEGKVMLSTNPSKSKTEQIVLQLFELLPERDQPLLGDIDRKLLRKD